MNEPAKFLVVNADDFGQSRGVTSGIIEAFERGIVTSTSLMVRWPAASLAAEYARSHPSLAVGLHLDFGEWLFAGGEWRPHYEVVELASEAAVRDEARRQLSWFRDIVGSDPTHVDSHQHAHMTEPLKSVAIDMARAVRVPLRHFSPGISYCGEFYGQHGGGEPYPEGIEIAALCRIIESLPSGTTELACHPGYADDLETMYRGERRLELQALCAPAVRETIAAYNVTLTSFRRFTPFEYP